MGIRGGGVRRPVAWEEKKRICVLGLHERTHVVLGGDPPAGGTGRKEKDLCIGPPWAYTSSGGGEIRGPEAQEEKRICVLGLHGRTHLVLRGGGGPPAGGT